MLSAKKISAQELYTFIESNDSEKKSILLDVRTPAEFFESHIDGSINVELSVFTGNEAFLAEASAIFVICRAGIRASIACQVIPPTLLGYTYILDGGMDSWIMSGYNVVRYGQVN